MKFFKRDYSRLSLEQLEIEKLIEKKERHEGDLDLDDLVEETKEQIDLSKKSEEKESEPAIDSAQTPDQTTEGSGERITGLDPEDTTPEPSDALIDEETEDPPAPEISAESLRETLRQETIALLQFTNPSFENYNDQDFYTLRPTSSNKAWTLTKDAFKYLGFLGIKLTTELLPKLLTKTFKGILYGFTRLAYGLMLAMTALEQYIRRRIDSFNNLRGNIQKAQQALELVIHAGPAELQNDDVYRDGRYIRQMAIGSSIDLESNLKHLHQFVDDSITGLGSSIREDLNGIRTLISYVRIGTEPNIDELLRVPLKVKNFKAGAIPGFTKDSPLVEDYHTTTTLPGNVTLLAQLPTTDSKSREEWIQAYKDSQMFLGVNKEQYKDHDSIPYLNAEELKNLISSLEKLCLLCIQHQTFYETLKRQKLEQRIYYRSYFENLTKSDKKIYLKDSLIDLVSLKNHFVDKVYLPAAIDIHDYCVRVINSYLKYIEKNVKVLTP